VLFFGAHARAVNLKPNQTRKEAALVSRLRLYYVARIFLRAFRRRGEGAVVRLYRKGHTRTVG